jgi:hypothetical protein
VSLAAVGGLERVDSVLDEAIQRTHIRDSEKLREASQRKKNKPINSSDFKMEKVHQVSEEGQRKKRR